jgi:hypothetical protein
MTVCKKCGNVLDPITLALYHGYCASCRPDHEQLPDFETNSSLKTNVNSEEMVSVEMTCPHCNKNVSAGIPSSLADQGIWVFSEKCPKCSLTFYVWRIHDSPLLTSKSLLKYSRSLRLVH